MSVAKTGDPIAFVRANTKILTPPLIPEIRLHLAEESLAIWSKTEDELGTSGLPPPYWAFAWAGGQALSRYLLDNPGQVADMPVLDLAAGCGLTAIAALKAGEGGFDLRLVADEKDLFDLFVGGRKQRLLHPVNDDTTAVVAAHDIHCDSHKWQERGKETPPALLKRNQAAAVTLSTWRPL